MSSSISYNGSPLVTINDGSLVTLTTQGKYVPGNIVITDTTDVSDALDAIEEKGVTIPSGAGRADLATLISQISQNGSGVTITDTTDAAGGTYRQINAVELGSDTVVANKLAAGYTAHNALGQAVTGPADILDTSNKNFWMGANPELVSRFYQKRTLLKDTLFNGWTPSTTAKAIIATETLSNISVDLANYEYWIVWRWDYVPTFVTGATMKAQITRQCGTMYQNIHRRPYGIANIAAHTDTYNYNLNLMSTSSSYCFYYSTGGSATWTSGISYGFYPGLNAPAFGSTSATSTTIAPKTPTFNARCYSSYFATARAPEVDQNNTTITIFGDLYRVKRGTSLVRCMYHDAIDIYNSPLTV